MGTRIEPRATIATSACDPQSDGKLHTDIRILLADGAQRWLTVSGQVYFAGTPPEAAPMFGTVVDITERKRAEESLRLSEEKYRILFTSMDEAFLLGEALRRADGTLDFLYSDVNPAFERLIGMPKQAIVGRTARAVIPSLEEVWFETVGSVGFGGESVNLEEYAAPIGKWLQTHYSPVGEKGSGKLVVIVSDITQRKQAEAALQRAHAELESRVQQRTAELQQLSTTRQELLQRLVMAQEDERRRIARELHDSLGQFLSALNLRFWTVEQANASHPQVQADMRQLRELLGQIEGELDRLTMELRPPALDDFGLPEAIRRYAAAWTQTTGIPADVYASGLDTERLPFAIETAVYRIVQEALTNILKHAQAAAVSIVLERNRADLRVIVEDNGRGFDPDAVAGQGEEGRRLGLVGIQERAALAGGQLEIESAPGTGTTLYVQIPIANGPKEESA